MIIFFGGSFIEASPVVTEGKHKISLHREGSLIVYFILVYCNMGITKTAGFEIRITQMAEILKALGHPARLAIMEHLAQSPSCICSDIVDELPLAQPTISRHLSELKRVGLIEGSISGKNVCYCINDQIWSQVKEAVDTISQTLLINKACC